MKDETKVKIDIAGTTLCWILCIFASIYFGSHLINAFLKSIL